VKCGRCITRGVCVALTAGLSLTAYAQEGHPVVGSWHGERGAGRNRADVTLVMDYDGEKITGVVNPGFDGLELRNATLNPKGWVLSFDVEAKDAAGKAVPCHVSGKLDRLGSDQRTVAGTWMCGTVKQAFKLTRDRDYSR
jgi:hypothetical protein